MRELTESFERSGNLHHAYLIEGERESARLSLLAFLGDALGIPVRGNPDVYVAEYETFGIDEGRYLQGLESMKAVGGGKKIFIIAFRTMTREAQNALLKLFEEPTDGTHFFLITDSAAALLPTFRSRLAIVTRPRHLDLGGTKIAKAFLAAEPAKRIDLFKQILEKKDKTTLTQFLSALETFLRGKGQEALALNANALGELERVRGYLDDSGSSPKMLLEHLAIVTPTSSFLIH